MTELWCILTFTKAARGDSVRGESWYATKSEAVAKMNAWKDYRSDVYEMHLVKGWFLQLSKPALWVAAMNHSLNAEETKVMKIWNRDSKKEVTV